MRFFLNLRAIRTKKTMTQTELANMIGVSQEQISKYERGHDTPSLEKLVEIACSLDVSLDELIEIKKTHQEYSEDMKKGR